MGINTQASDFFRLSDIYIDPSVGNGRQKSVSVQRSLKIYAGIYLLGIHGFCALTTSRFRVASLGLLFPGAGLVAIATPLSLSIFLLTTVLFLFALFLWLACGALVLPVFVWSTSAIVAALIPNETLSRPVSIGVLLIPLVLSAFLRWLNIQRLSGAIKRRDLHNKYLTEYIKSRPYISATPKAPGTREVDLRTLRFVQWFIETGLLPANDWSRHTMVDQFQTAALRYQLYQTVYSLQAYQCHYVPNYSGALADACRNAIRKAQCEKVNSFWKWECMWGKLNFHDWNPIKKDNIMVTGYYALAVALYEANTGDFQFRKNNSMEFIVDRLHRYKTNLPGVVEALFQNMRQSKYTLYPCEPHWIYSACNLFGIIGLVVADRTFGTNYSAKVRANFAKSFNENFCEPDGSIVSIYSTVTGLSLPGSIGIAGNCMTSVLCSPFLPAIGHRAWALVRREAVTYDEDGILHLSLHGADKVDPGNYHQTEGVSRVLCGQAAAEFGDSKLRDDCLRQLDEVYHPVQRTSTGSLYNSGLSVFMQGRALEARLWQVQDWANMVRDGVLEVCFKGPNLQHVPFPQVLVAKAWSHDGIGLDLVLYNGLDPGNFEISFSRLQPGMKYSLNSDLSIIADHQGRAKATVGINGRTEFVLVFKK